MITEVTHNKERYMDLLLLGDEQEDMVWRYLHRGRLFVLRDEAVRVVCVVTDEGGGVLEVKNIATAPDSRCRGYARRMLDALARRFAPDFSVMQAGTGDSPLTVPFYEKCGFVRSHRVENFFTDHYDHPIVECGVQLRDMIYFRKTIGVRPADSQE